MIGSDAGHTPSVASPAVAAPRWKSEKERYWVAGILEGEGYFGLNRRQAGRSPTGKKQYIQLRVECNMCDEDVIRQLTDWAGVGNTAGPYTQSPERKPMWRFIVNRKAEAEALMRDLYPLLSKRRREQITAAFTAVGLPPP